MKHKLEHLSTAVYVLAGMFLGVGFEHMGPDLKGYIASFIIGMILLMAGGLLQVASEA